MVIRELDIGLRPATIPPIIQVGVVYFRVNLSLRVQLKNVHDDERDDITSDDGRFGFRSQEISHFYFLNSIERVGSDERDGYRSHTSHYYSYNPGDCVSVKCGASGLISYLSPVYLHCTILKLSD